MTTTRTRAPTRPRSGVRTFRPTRTWPALTPLGVALLVVLALLVAGVGASLARAEDGEEAPGRFSPASRGPRASYETERVQRWREAVDAYPWSTETALRVIACESEGRADAVNPASGAIGLFQTMPSWSWLAERLFGEARLAIPWVNIATAYALWEDSGGTFGWHWSASARCWR